jgi:glycosyltransferase involved in cell wall biosynthesis
LLLSFVIPTYNRARLLAETIPVFANLQTAGGVAYEVIFVDNGSTDSTPSVLDDAVRRFPDKFRCIRIAPTGGPSAPRNVGIRAAVGEVLIIADDDFLPDSDLVLRYAEFHTRYPEQHHAAVGEAYVPEWLLDDPVSWIHKFDYGRLRNLHRLSYMDFWTCNVSVKRQFMLSAGMFDESFLFYEDVLCAYRMQQNGMHLHFWQAARGQHLHQTTLEGLPMKGLFVGRWLHSFLERIGHDPVAMIRLKVLSTDLPKLILLKLTVRRIAFRALDNPPVRLLLEMLGAHRSKRGRLAELYTLIIYHSAVLAGYYEAKRNAEAGHPLNLIRLESELSDRGDR